MTSMHSTMPGNVPTHTDRMERLLLVREIEELLFHEANLLDTSNELEEASAVYKKLKDMKTILAATNSNLEIALLEIESLKAALKKAEALNTLLRKGI